MRKNIIVSYVLIAGLACHLVSCSRKITFEELTTYPGKVKLNHYQNEKMGYSISLLNNLTLSYSDYSSSYGTEEFIDDKLFDQSKIMAISIVKYEKPNSSLITEWNELLLKRTFAKNWTIKSSNSTDFLETPSIYEYMSIDNLGHNDFEQVCFLTTGKKDDYFLITIRCYSEENYPETMQQLLQCAKTFTILDTEEERESDW